MDEVVLTKPVSWLDGVDPETGVLTQPGHPQRGAVLAGKVVRLPHSVGSTVGAYTFFKMARAGTAPRKIVVEEPDSVTLCAALAGIEVEVEGWSDAPEAPVEGVPEEFKRYLELEASARGASDYVRIGSAHISGVSYWTIGLSLIHI